MHESTLVDLKNFAMNNWAGSTSNGNSIFFHDSRFIPIVEIAAMYLFKNILQYDRAELLYSNEKNLDSSKQWKIPRKELNASESWGNMRR